ncbi:MAG: uroporphyrinogen-III C-methyltransferase [Halioglobus sp.]|nr:uroporphyrinogen-III C-methyltransferase [Halioglobus sp.]
MSDQEDKAEEVVEEEATRIMEVQEDEPEPQQAVTETRPRKSSSAVGWLALLVALGLGGGAAWLLPQLQQGKSELDALQGRLAQLESSAGSERDSIDRLEDGLRRELQGGLQDLKSRLSGESSKFASALAAMEEQLAGQRAELARYSANDRSSWLLAEAEYLLRLANQRLIMAGDTVAARALLGSADEVLKEIDDVGLHDVRAAVAADLAAIRAVPTIDTEGIYLRLSALVEQADKLVIFEMPDAEALAAPAPADDWQGRLRQGWEAAWQKLTDYIVIRRRDVPMQALMDPQWEGLVRQNLRMLLEQAQVALLSGNQTLYRESLERAGQWVAQFRDSDEAGSDAMQREINQLSSLRIAVDMPDISRSLRELDAAVERRVDQPAAGGE